MVPTSTDVKTLIALWTKWWGCDLDYFFFFFHFSSNRDGSASFFFFNFRGSRNGRKPWKIPFPVGRSNLDMFSQLTVLFSDRRYPFSKCLTTCQLQNSPFNIIVIMSAVTFGLAYAFAMLLQISCAKKFSAFKGIWKREKKITFIDQG